MTNTPMHPSVQQKIRHAIHLRWNRSRFNQDWDEWVMDCICCCGKCEPRLDRTGT